MKTENTIIVMIAEGKNDSTDFVTIKLFDDRDEAVKVITEINEAQEKNDSKYWKTANTANIVNNEQQIEIDYEFNPTNS